MVIGNVEAEMRQLKERLATELELTNLRQLKYFIGIEVASFKKGILFCNGNLSSISYKILA